MSGKVIKADSESVACSRKVNSSRGFLNIGSSCFPVFRKCSTTGLTQEHFSEQLQRTHVCTQDSARELFLPLTLCSYGSWITERIRNTLLSSAQRPSLTGPDCITLCYNDWLLRVRSVSSVWLTRELKAFCEVGVWTPWMAGRLTALLLIQERSTARLNPQTNVFRILKISSGIFRSSVNLEFTKM